jgi:hypothetical protein
MDPRLRAEINRLHSRPPVALCPPMLSAFTVDVEVHGPGSMGAYASRFRDGIEAGVKLAERDAFDDCDELPESSVPEWLAVISSETFDRSSASGEAINGRNKYLSVREQEAWKLQDWLWTFEPGVRQWEWWDITSAGGVSIQIWLDSKGESSYPCEEVRWLAYVSGARSVSGPIILPKAVWDGQTSLGL